jgi:hypothetical protein
MSALHSTASAASFNLRIGSKGRVLRHVATLSLHSAQSNASYRIEEAESRGCVPLCGGANTSVFLILIKIIRGPESDSLSLWRIKLDTSLGASHRSESTGCV